MIENHVGLIAFLIGFLLGVLIHFYIFRRFYR